MNILHIVEDFSFQGGGIRTVVKDLNERLLHHKINSTIISPRYEKNDDIIKIKGDGAPWSYSKDLKKTLKRLCYDKHNTIIHIHGVWMYIQYAAAKFAKQNNIPYLITIHGMYEPWLWSQGTLKKKIYFNFLVKKHFSFATYLHAITNNEAKEIEKLFPSTPIKVIPNLIDAENSPNKSSKFSEKYILYLGRINSKKGIDILINAFSKIKKENVKLKIAGGPTVYKEQLELLVKKLGISDKVEFLGLITGEEKKTLFKKAFLFVAPSHSEVIGMVNLEAAIQGTPVITTYQTGLDKEWANNGGTLINPTEADIEIALNKNLSLTIKERNSKGTKLQNFVVKKYSWQHRLKDWKQLYSTMLNSNL